MKNYEEQIKDAWMRLASLFSKIIFMPRTKCLI